MNRREFHFSEGSSNKFWAIELGEKSFIVHYGRVGTQGQSQEKVFANEALAKKEHDKLIAEKTKKGYVEVGIGELAKSRPTPVRKEADAAKKEKPSAPSKEAKAAAEPAPESTSVSDPAPLTLERRVRLAPEDRARVPWLWEPLPPPPPRPFDYERCVSEALAWHSGSRGFVRPNEVKMPSRMTREEAWFWIRARDAGLTQRPVEKNWTYRYNRQVMSNDEWKQILLEATSPAEPPRSPKENALVQEILEEVSRSPQWIPALLPIFHTRELAELLLEAELRRVAQVIPLYHTHFFHVHPNLQLVEAFGELVLVYESAEERRKFREVIATRFHAESDPRSIAAQLALGLLCLVGGGEELRQVLEASGPPNPALNLFTLLGLPDEESFLREAKRLGIKLAFPGGYELELPLTQHRLWLAATEWRCLEPLVTALLQGTSKEETTRFARVLALVEAPEVAPAMLEVQLNSKAPLVAIDWFQQHPLHTAVGLTPVAMTSGKAAEAAREHLSGIKRAGKLDVLEAALPHLPENAQAWLKREVIDFAEEELPEIAAEELPAPLAEALAALKPIKAPAWLRIHGLSPIKIMGKKLSLAQVERVLSALKDSSPPLIAALKEHAAPTSLDAFAWKLLEQWLAMGGPSKEKWALTALGQIGGDACVLKLTPLVRDWPGESQHKRAVLGLEVLRAIGTDTALMSLNGIAQKIKFQGLKEKATVLMEEIAEARGLTREQLADRIVPDCGLDETGGRVFDFGPRQFKFVLGPEMKPLVRDAAGKLKPDLPAPNNADDREKAEAAVASWKVLKKTLREALKVQVQRLEDAMITGRRWTPEEFQTLIIQHPLMVNLARQLVFGGYDESGALTRTFRMTEDQSLADGQDEACELPQSGTVGLVHPAHLDEASKGTWGQVLSDYEIIPPFAQLGRQICHPERGDLELTEITRFKGPKIPGIVVYGILERSHWLRDKPADAGGFEQHSKYFPAADVTAFIQYTGMGIGYYDDPQEIESVYFVPGHIKPEWWGDHKDRVKIKDVDTVVMSEVLRLVHAIVSKAE